MKNNIAKIISVLMTAMMIIGFAAVFQAKAAPPTGNVVYVDPHGNVFPPPSLGVGSHFFVNVSIANMTGIAGYEFKLFWDPAVLNGVGFTENLFATFTPSGQSSNIWELSAEVGADHIWAAYTYKNLTKAYTLGYAPINVSEAGIAALIVELEVVAVPSMVEGFLYSDLNVTTSSVGAMPPPYGPGGAIAHTTVNGYYQLNWAPPTVLPYYSVDPPTFLASAVGQIFNIDVKVNNLDPGWEAVGFEFKLSYNNTLLQVLNVTEGPWLPPFGNSPNQGTNPMIVEGSNYVLFGDLVLPDANGTWHAPFPQGSGVLATIQFKALLQGDFPVVLSCPLDLYATKIANWLAEPIGQGPAQDGFYSIRARVLGRNIDVYVGQDGVPYPDPYGGQGWNSPADMFWPQKQVCVWANVTYNNWPEQQKDVAFQIIDPHGTTWGVIYARTDANGVATTCFRLPWPCDHPEYWIGVWTIIGTVDIACVIVNDTVQFHYDYLVEIWKVTTDQPEYNHLDTMNITAYFGSHAQQMYNVTVAVTALDETGVPFGFAYKQVTIGGTVFCQYKNYTEGLSIFIPKFARAGTAEIDTALLNDWPFNGGTVQSGFYLPPWIGYCPIEVAIKAQ